MIKHSAQCEHTIDYEQVLNHLPGICFIKDTNFKYIYLNHAAVNAVRYMKQDEIYGKTDFEMPWPHLAEKFISQDALVLKGKDCFTLEETPTARDVPTTVVLLKKTPFVSRNNNIQGVFCLGFELSTENHKDLISYLAITNLNYQDFVINPSEQKKRFRIWTFKIYQKTSASDASSSARKH